MRLSCASLLPVHVPRAVTDPGAFAKRVKWFTTKCKWDPFERQWMESRNAPCIRRPAAAAWRRASAAWKRHPWRPRQHPDPGPRSRPVACDPSPRRPNAAASPPASRSRACCRLFWEAPWTGRIGAVCSALLDRGLSYDRRTSDESGVRQAGKSEKIRIYVMCREDGREKRRGVINKKRVAHCLTSPKMKAGRASTLHAEASLVALPPVKQRWR